MWASLDSHTSLEGFTGGRSIDISLSSLSLGKKTDLLVFTSRLKFPFPQTFMRNMPAGHRQWDLFPTTWPFLVSFPSCLKPSIHCGCKTVMHFSVAENKRTSMSAHLTWKPLMILSLGRVAVAKWLFCVRLSHLPILINPQDCLFAVSVTCWYRENSQLMVDPKKISSPIHSHEILFQDTSMLCKNAIPKQFSPVLSLKNVLSLKQDKNIHRGRFTGGPVDTVGLQYSRSNYSFKFRCHYSSTSFPNISRGCHNLMSWTDGKLSAEKHACLCHAVIFNVA